jgi:hypothetical protein
LVPEEVEWSAALEAEVCQEEPEEEVCQEEPEEEVLPAVSEAEVCQEEPEEVVLLVVQAEV